ncbi:hypothetical protein AERO_12450 [Aeromicrobium fastidiosum]|uniref:hypothetical protein n=1 Tax=Aeromicrobium fastidiosum TaxID=52699 RepID=UPI0020233E8B|nr:hypothetical protein [Aeromicrobium fastidiosum]MCL8252196.1 hypothetical protein [Aeromicrobium fastidiosum]
MPSASDSAQMRRDAVASCAKALALKTAVDPSVLDLATPVLFQLMREGLVHSTTSSEHVGASVQELVEGLHELAHRSQRTNVGAALDWWSLAYLGHPIDGSFFRAGDSFPQARRLMEAALHPPRALTRQLMEAEHEARAATLRSLADDVTPTSRAIFEALIVRTVHTVFAELSQDPTSDLKWVLGEEPEDLVARADPERSVPRNGLRWPGLVSRARELQTAIRALTAATSPLAALPAGEFDLTDVNPTSWTELEVALFSSPSSPAEALLDECLAEPPSMSGVSGRCLVALLDRVGVSRPWISSIQSETSQEIAAMRQELEGLLPRVSPAEASACEEVANCLEWGLTDDAAVWLGEIRRAAELKDLKLEHERLLGLARAVDTTPGASVFALLDSLRTLLDQGDDVAAHLIADAISRELDVSGNHDTSGEGQDPSARRARSESDHRRDVGPRELVHEGARSRHGVGRSEVSRAISERLFTELVSLGPEMEDPSQEWFWHLVATSIEVGDRRIVWGGLRQSFLRAAARSPDLEGLLAPPSPPSSWPDRRGAPVHSSLSPRVPKRTLNASILSIIGPAIERLDADDRAGAAREFLLAARSGWLPGFAHSIASSLEAEDPRTALATYHEFSSSKPTALVPASTAWNVAVAYEWLHDDQRAASTLGYFLSVLPNLVDTEQKTQIQKFVARTHLAVPLDAHVLARRSAQTTVESPESTSEVQIAREQYGRGDSTGAEARLKRLLAEVPKSPGAFLLMRMYRESQRWKDAETLVAELEATGSATWKHYVELARIHFDSGRPTASLSILNRAIAVEPAASNHAEYLTLRSRAEGQATEEARAMATLGGAELNLHVLERLAAGGNLKREDWERTARRHIANGETEQVVRVARPLVAQQSWIAPTVIDAVIDARVPLADAHLRRQLMSLALESTSMVVERLDHYLQSSADDWPSPAAEVLEDCCALLESAAQKAAPLYALRLTWRWAHALESMGREEEAASTRRHLPPRPHAAPLVDAQTPPLVEPMLQRISGSKLASRALLEAIDTSDEQNPGLVADKWVEALEGGAAVAGAPAIGWLVRAQRYTEAVELYLQYDDVLYPSPSLLWNVAAALAGAGQHLQALTWFTICATVSESDPQESQRIQRDQLFRSFDVAPPPRRVASDDLHLSEGPLTQSEFAHAVRGLRDRIGSGRLDPDAAYEIGLKLHRRIIDSSSAQGTWAVLLQDTGRSADSMQVLRQMHDSRQLTSAFGGLLARVAMSTGDEREALAMLESIPNDHVTLMSKAKLHLSIGDERPARTLADRAVRLSPKYDEALLFVSKLKSGQSPLKDPTGPGVTITYIGKTRNNEVEVLIAVEPRATIHDLRLLTSVREIELGEFGSGGSEQLIPLLLDGSELTDRLTFSYAQGGEVSRKKRGIRRPAADHPPTPTLPFDPTQPAAPHMFVGRSVDIAAIETHYEHLQQIVFLGGPRQVGKTSLVRRCCVRGREGDSSLILAMLDGEQYDVDSSFLTQLAQSIEEEFRARGEVIQQLEHQHASISDFRRWYRDHVFDHTDGHSLVFAIDEVQVMLDRLAVDGHGKLDEVAGLIRSLNTSLDLPLKFLLLGSCTYASVRDRLERTNVAAELTERLVGFMPYEEMENLLEIGFGSGPSRFYVLPGAHEVFWDLTAGYPNHVHLLAKKVGEILTSRGERIIQPAVVLQAADALVGSEGVVVEHLLGRERERDYQQQVLAALADFFGADHDDAGGANAPTQLQLIERLGHENADGVDRFLRLGLLRRTSEGTIAVANGLIKRWLVDNQLKLQLRIASIRADSEFEQLQAEGFEIRSPTTTDGLGRKVTLSREGRYYRARPVPAGISADDLTTHLEEDLSTVSTLVDIVGGWMIMTHAHGRSLSDYESTPSSQMGTNWERRDTVKVVRAVRDAAATLAQQSRSHGNLDADVLIEGPTGLFLADFAFGSGRLSEPLTDFRPGPLRPPEQGDRFADGLGFVPSDDVYALGALLFSILGTIPAVPPKSGSAGLSSFDVAAASPVPRVGVDHDLVRVMTAMCHPNPSDRYDLAAVRDSLSHWLRQFQ